MSSRSGWLDYWDGDVSLYVGPRHLEAHYDGLYEAIRPLLPRPPFTVLDFGCGEALMAPALAAAGGRVLLHDAAPSRAAILRARFAGLADVEVVEDLASQAGACDVILLISVIQYVPKPDLPALLGRLRACLKPGGRLVIGDVPAPDTGVLADVSALLRFAWAEGFFLAALRGLARTLRSDYGRMRGRLGLSTWAVDELAAVLAAAGFAPTVLEHNIGHAPHRHSLVATLPA